MMKINKDSKKKRDESNGTHEKEVGVEPLATLNKNHATECAEVCSEILDKLRDVEELIEIIARELARQAEAKK